MKLAMSYAVEANTKPYLKLPRIEIAIRIKEVLLRTLSDPTLFTCRAVGPGHLWISESFHIASARTPFFTSCEVWPIQNKSGLLQHPVGEKKAMNLHLLPDGSYELVAFRRGGWERDLLRYVGAPLGLLTIRECL